MGSFKYYVNYYMIEISRDFFGGFCLLFYEDRDKMRFAIKWLIL